ncbi:MAG: TnpV protein [Ruminococcaceae bacterium]|nr:TnpV protein [Oscillospiraceae bacterium]
MNLCGDYYIIASEDEPEREPLGIWGQRHLTYIQKHREAFYKRIQSENKLCEYLIQSNRDAEDMFNRLVKQMEEREGVTE